MGEHKIRVNGEENEDEAKERGRRGAPLESLRIVVDLITRLCVIGVY